MSANYNVPTINNRLQQVANAIDAGGAAGMIRLLDIGGNLLSSLKFAFPCATVAGGVLSFSGLSLIDAAAAGGGTGTPAVRARCEDSTGTAVISGLTVGGPGSSADIVFSPTNTIKAGQTIAITAATITGH